MINRECLKKVATKKGYTYNEESNHLRMVFPKDGTKKIYGISMIMANGFQLKPMVEIQKHCLQENGNVMVMKISKLS